MFYAPIAQLDRASDYGSGGCGFDFYWAHHFREVAQLGRALGLGPRGRRFESCLPDHYELVYWGLSSAGRAPALHAGGQRFDPARLHQLKNSNHLLFYHGGLAQLARAYGSYP